MRVDQSLWPRLAGLPLVIEACEYERLHAVLAHEFERITTYVRLVGAGVDGWARTSPCSARMAPRCMRPAGHCLSRENGHWPPSASISRRSSCGLSRRNGTGAALSQMGVRVRGARFDPFRIGGVTRRPRVVPTVARLITAMNLCECRASTALRLAMLGRLVGAREVGKIEVGSLPRARSGRVGRRSKALTG